MEAEIGTAIDSTTIPNTTEVSTWIEEAEAWIDERLGSSFSSGTITNAIIPFDEHNAFKAAHIYPQYSAAGVDYGLTRAVDSIYLIDSDGKRIAPIISMDLARNTATTDTASDSWGTLRRSSGTGGDYVLDALTGLVSFKQNYPNWGLQRAIRWTGNYGFTPTPLRINTLATKLVARRILQSKIKAAQFESPHSFSLEGFAVRRDISQNVDYLKELDREIEEMYRELAQNFQSDVVK